MVEQIPKKAKSKTPENKEKQGVELGVYEETEKLNLVMMWGLPGAETILGQMLPKDASLFEESFDVIKAREELKNAMDLLEKNGVEIFKVKDRWAEMIESKGIKSEMSMDDLKQRVREKGEYFYNKYRGDRENENGGEDSADLDVLDLLDGVLDEDVRRYGENAAVIINQRLSLSGFRDEKLDESLPLSNIFYARDQSNLLGKTLVWSSMRHEIRKPEVEIYKEVVRHSGILEGYGINEVEVQNDGDKGFFEGGDGIPNNGIVYIGIGGRTDLEGVKQIAEPILREGLRLVVERDRKRSNLGENEMDAMHLDTYWMPLGINEIVMCEEEVDRRRSYEFLLDEKNQLTLQYLGDFRDHLAERKITEVPLTKEEQLRYAPNFLNLGNGKVILSLAKGNELTSKLEGKGMIVLNADLQEVTKGHGGLHCATAALSRG